jgi:hypothetical protein
LTILKELMSRKNSAMNPFKLWDNSRIIGDLNNSLS